MSTIINASTSSGLIQTADTSGTLVLQSNGTTQFTVDSTGAYGTVERGTAVASTSGTSINFTGIPSWVKRITVIFNGVSLSGTSNYLVQLGTSSGVVTTGYASSGLGYGAALSSTAGHIVQSASASRITSSIVTITNITSNTWVGAAVYGADTASAGGGVTTMNIALSGTLDRVTITTVNGTDTFDAGSINILYEG
jgi:hypothetical protein